MKKVRYKVINLTSNLAEKPLNLGFVEIYIQGGFIYLYPSFSLEE